MNPGPLQELVCSNPFAYIFSSLLGMTFLRLCGDPNLLIDLEILWLLIYALGAICRLSPSVFECPTNRNALHGNTSSEFLRLHIAGRPCPTLLCRSSKVICDSTTGTQTHQSQCLEGGPPQDKNKEESSLYVYLLQIAYAHTSFLERGKSASVHLSMMTVA